ncbi:MAG: hypothetical protein KC656_10885, partial [Myxococcales bacterium]|nr:hypothetical protein [Myxococcales bacterium]
MIALLAASLAAEPGWLVLETDHHRIVYPAEASEFTEHLAARLDAIREAVELEVGNRVRTRTEIVVHDPYSLPSGEAYPIGRRPRMDLWAHAPTADDELGFYGSFDVVLAAHEDAHVVHALRAPRNVTGRVLFESFGIAPILRKSPPWVLEGYATVVEGRVTGSGRPHGAWRATMLRRMAQDGTLPSYGALSGRWRYIVASAFLEWLDAREGGDSLKRVWARLAARERRTVEGAFAGVYGARLPELYARFTAELTADAMRSDGSAWRRETAILRLQGPTRGMSLSPDGSRLAVARSDGEGVVELVVVGVRPDERA